jgi:hypothetical protein
MSEFAYRFIESPIRQFGRSLADRVGKTSAAASVVTTVGVIASLVIPGLRIMDRLKTVRSATTQGVQDNPERPAFALDDITLLRAISN